MPTSSRGPQLLGHAGWRGAAYAVVFLALAAACGGGSSKQTSATTKDGSTVTTAKGTGGGGGGKQVVKVSFPGGGPVDNNFPQPKLDAFGLLKNRRCGDLRSVTEKWKAIDRTDSAIDLYHGAAEACLGNWSQASADLARVNLAEVTADPDTACDRKLVFAFLQAMIQAHEANPGAAPDTGGSGSSCPDTTVTTPPSSAPKATTSTKVTGSTSATSKP